MKPIADERIEALEDLAIESIAHIRAFFKYQGKDPIYLQKAKQAATVIGTYGRIRASETNRMAVELAARRRGEALPAPAPALTE